MSRIMLVFAAVLVIAAFAVPAVFAEEGDRDSNETFQEQIERIKNRAAELRERFRGRFENRGQPFHWARHDPHAGRAIADGEVTDISVSSITVGEETFVVADETQRTNGGQFLQVTGPASSDGEHPSASVAVPGG